MKVISPTTLTGDMNQDFVGLLVIGGNISFLLPGDREGLSSPVTVLKEPHHGSDGSVSNLQTVSPKLAINRVGAGNV